jgi:hypothetical protein
MKNYYKIIKGAVVTEKSTARSGRRGEVCFLGRHKGEQKRGKRGGGEDI